MPWVISMFLKHKLFQLDQGALAVSDPDVMLSFPPALLTCSSVQNVDPPEPYLVSLIAFILSCQGPASLSLNSLATTPSDIQQGVPLSLNQVVGPKGMRVKASTVKKSGIYTILMHSTVSD